MEFTNTITVLKMTAVYNYGLNINLKVTSDILKYAFIMSEESILKIYKAAWLQIRVYLR